ncbi:hypothetical protein AQUCO_01400014v1 [Aquilegia coerulea]|uniref:AB hydrolase-1 domain-containing protein n=1 Tax=Aquilegia coerulea TaxID=218851 RepID=A0A2G5DU37_AQUCA|nr:hypothetical protein AQUCO_01400014v1 [Aquilegia coerulea]
MVIGGGGGAAAAISSCCGSPVIVPPLPLFKSSSSSTILAAAQLQQFIGCAHWRGRKRRAGISRFGTGLLHYQPPITYNAALTINNSLELELNEIKDNSKKWDWRGHSINYFLQHSPQQQQQRPPLLLVHGFGASIPHWRRNIGILSQSYTVYAIDLLGFGASDKPAGFTYTMELWAQLILDFLTEVVRKPTVLIGNSVGSLACVIAASESTNGLVRGLVLLNCAGGMNNKAVVDDWRIKLLLPLLWLIDFLLKQRGIASVIFERVKQRENLRNILLSVYGNKEAVDEILVEVKYHSVIFGFVA